MKVFRSKGLTKSSMVLSLSILAFYSLSASAAPTEASMQNAEQQYQSNIEAIDVIGDRPLSYYRRNLVKQENAFFDLMNQLIDEDDFKVTCKKQRMQAFSRLKARACEANFVSRIIGEATQQNFDSMSLSSRMGGPDGVNLVADVKIQLALKKRQREQLEAMVETINNNPELLSAYQALELAKQKVMLAQQQ
ncbi:hypothetical protein ACFO4O_14200 [Glaciecola siphonariae]|uniref:Uncharacterized protein n=1 Tax=Glaciecola siphonariae TaxID=521012 RepID=A0ABV9M104_9ALTE